MFMNKLKEKQNFRSRSTINKGIVLRKIDNFNISQLENVEILQSFLNNSSLRSTNQSVLTYK